MELWSTDLFFPDTLGPRVMRVALSSINKTPELVL